MPLPSHPDNADRCPHTLRLGDWTRRCVHHRVGHPDAHQVEDGTGAHHPPTVTGGKPRHDDVNRLVIVTADEVDDALSCASLALYVARMSHECTDGMWVDIDELLTLHRLLAGVHARRGVSS